MQHISKVYTTELVETHALSDFSLKVEEGEFVAVTGPSGSGKTTFLNVAGLLETFDAGTYHLDGLDVRNLDDNRRSRIRNEKIGFIFQSFNLIPELDIFDNVGVPLRYRRMRAAERRRRVSDVLERVGLTSRTKHLPSQLSGGQQQRVAIARALAGEPSVIFAGAADHEAAGRDQCRRHYHHHGHAQSGAGTARTSQRADRRRPDCRVAAVPAVVDAGKRQPNGAVRLACCYTIFSSPG
jgi:ABC-type lipoprotein export system ATPase subunit